jgi:sugar phosphate isomerase/epimerase
MAQPEIFLSFFMFTADLRPDDEAYSHILIEHLEKCRAMGYRGFDVHIAPQPPAVDHELEKESYRTLKRRFDAAGLQDVKFSTNVGTTPTFDPTSPYAEQRKHALSYLKSRVDITAILGGKDSIMAGPFLYPYGAFPQTDLGAPIWSDALQDWMAIRYDDAKKTMDELAAYADGENVKLAIEPVKSWETPGPNMVSEVLDFLATLESSTCGVAIDTAQVVMESRGPLVFKDNVARAVDGKRLHSVHISAPDRGAVDDCWIPWNTIMGTIAPKFAGPYLIEIFNAIPPFDSSMRMARRRFWRPGEDTKSRWPSAYTVAERALETFQNIVTPYYNTPA